MASRLRRFRRVLVGAVLVSITINSVLAIWALLAGDFDETQVRVLATSFLVTGAMLGVLINGAALRARTMWPLPLLAATAPAVGFALLIITVWSSADAVFVTKAGVSGLVVGFAATLACAVRLVPPTPPLRMPHLATAALLTTLATTVLVMIWAELDSDAIFRFVGVQSVLVAGLVIAIPVWARFGPGSRRTSPLVGQGSCPCCGAPLDPETGRYQGKP